MLKKVKKRIIKKYQSKLNKVKIKKTNPHFSQSDLIKDLKRIGIESKDIILVHSSLKSIGYVENGPISVINSILDVIGTDGTLLMPTYTMKTTMYKTCLEKNYVFNVLKSPTTLGAIPSAFLKLKGIHRSIHPTHSFSAIGKYSKQITETHQIGNKTFGENSPWAKLIELNGKILGIGITLGPTTQYHYVEDIMGDNFPIRVKMDKIYKLKCKTYDRKIIDVYIQPLDPEVAKTRIDRKENSFIQEYFWEIYERLGILNIGKIGDAQSWWVDAKKFCVILMKLAKLGITIYSNKETLKKKQLYPFKKLAEKLNIK